ncbi:hypothetical protein [Streptomyces sp. NPDC087300]|uniref:hypothetical protein n=1 Tax=Streptomyces sp. NPDC087300 TaxID=3365780 RepID=UPI003812D283
MNPAPKYVPVTSLSVPSEPREGAPSAAGPNDVTGRVPGDDPLAAHRGGVLVVARAAAEHDGGRDQRHGHDGRRPE